MQNDSTLTKSEWGIALIALCVVVACVFSSSSDDFGLLFNTARLGMAVLLVAMPIAGILAFCLTRCTVRWRSFWEACLLLLLFLPLYIQLASWEAGFGRGGWYSTLIAERLSNPPLEGFRGAVWVHAVAAIPWLFWILRLGFSSVPRTYEEAAMLDAKPIDVFRRITLPLVLPALVAAAFYVFIVVSTEITVTDRYQFRSYAEVIYYEFRLNDRFEEVPLSVAPVIASMVGVCVCGLLLCRLLLPRMVHATVTKPPTAQRVNWLATSIVMFAIAMLLFVPVGNLFYQAGIDVQELQAVQEADGQAQRTRVWSATKMLQLVGASPIRYREELAYTAILAQLSVLASLVLATQLAWWGRRHPWRQFVGTLIGTVCFVTPGPFIGLGLIWLLTIDSDSALLKFLYDDTLFAPWLAITIRCFPFVYLIVWFSIRSIPQTIFEAAASDGASEFETLWRIALPMIAPSLVCAGLVGLAVAVGELSACILVMPPGVFTVATEIFQLIHYGAEDQLAGLCLSCIGLVVLLACLARAALYRLLVR